MTLEYEDFVFNQLFDTSQFRELFNVVLQKPSRSNFYGQSEQKHIFSRDERREVKVQAVFKVKYTQTQIVQFNRSFQLSQPPIRTSSLTYENSK